MEWNKLEQCPSCGGGHVHFDTHPFEDKLLNYSRCLTCSLVFMNPVPDQEWYNDFYAHLFWEQKGQKFSKPIINKVAKQARWAKKLSLFLHNHLSSVKNMDRLLEIGCGYGLIVRLLADEFGAKPYGVEPSVNVAKFAEQKTGVPIIAANMDSLSNLEAPYQYDLIINSHVLENIVDLKIALGTYTRLLSDGGYLLIDTPNLFYQKSLGIVHPYVFCERSLRHLLMDSGFTIVSLKKSGWGKSVILPRHMTVLAKRADTAVEINDKSGDPLFGWKCKFGWGLEKIVRLKWLSRLDRKVVSMLCRPTEKALKLVEQVYSLDD